MFGGMDEDVPLRVDFRDPEVARTWIEQTRIKRPHRPRFFVAFCDALAAKSKLRILELGSGPGQLTREILSRCDVASYVALGNSITAGYQSGGINDSTQRQSYALLLARQMGTRYAYPALTMPGCAPPINNVRRRFSSARNFCFF